jgi:dihydropteroate synthase
MMQARPADADVAGEVRDFFLDRVTRLNHCGVGAEQIIFDPGIGFGKTPEQNLQLLGALRSFTTLERPLLLGASRKSFIGKLLGAELADRLPASLACAVAAVEAGVQLIRAHDVAETVQAVRMTEAIVAQRK